MRRPGATSARLVLALLMLTGLLACSGDDDVATPRGSDTLTVRVGGMVQSVGIT